MVGKFRMIDLSEGESRGTVLVAYFGALIGSVGQIDGIKAGGEVRWATAWPVNWTCGG